VKQHRTSRRRFLQWAAGAGVASGSALLGTPAQALPQRSRAAVPAAVLKR